MGLMNDIHIRSFTGSGLRPYLHGLAKLRMEVFQEYPYLETPDLYREMDYLRKIASCKEAIAVLIFDHSTLVGSALGYPLSLEDPTVLKPLIDRNFDISSSFLFGDPLLLTQYRGRGIGHHFFDARESHVQHLPKYKHICFYTFDIPACDPLKPADYVPLTDFWRKRGYIHHPEIHFELPWKSPKEGQIKMRPMSFWYKEV